MGQVPLSSRIAEVEYAISQGAAEIDIVIDRGLANSGNFIRLYNDIRAIKSVCINGNVTLKTILSVTELNSYETIYKVAMMAMMAGSDFIKTSTGEYILKYNYYSYCVFINIIFNVWFDIRKQLIIIN